MELKNQLSKGYVAGSRSYAQTFGKRPFWDRLIFAAVLVEGGRGTEGWMRSHSTMASGWRFLIAIAVAGALGVIASVVLDKLRSINQA